MVLPTRELAGQAFGQPLDHVVLVLVEQGLGQQRRRLAGRSSWLMLATKSRRVLEPPPLGGVLDDDQHARRPVSLSRGTARTVSTRQAGRTARARARPAPPGRRRPLLMACSTSRLSRAARNRRPVVPVGDLAPVVEDHHPVGDGAERPRQQVLGLATLARRSCSTATARSRSSSERSSEARSRRSSRARDRHVEGAQGRIDPLGGGGRVTRRGQAGGGADQGDHQQGDRHDHGVPPVVVTPSSPFGP